MKYRCAILDDYQNVALGCADWSRIAADVEILRFGQRFATEDDLVAAIGGCEIVVAMRERTLFPASVFERLPRLRLLVTSGMRNAAIDLDAAARAGVTVCGTGSSPDPAVELTWALLLGLARRIKDETLSPGRTEPWQSTLGVDLHEKTLGLLGLGKIGSKVAAIGRAFGMEVMAWSQNLQPERAEALGVVHAGSKDRLLEESDVVSVHLVLSERTRGLIGSREFELMRPSALFINTSRAQIVDEAALAGALKGGKIAGAGIDVFSEEPVPQDFPLLSAPNLLATPHLGYVTEANYSVYFREAVEDIQAFLRGAPMRVID